MLILKKFFDRFSLSSVVAVARLAHAWWYLTARLLLVILMAAFREKILAACQLNPLQRQLRKLLLRLRMIGMRLMSYLFLRSKQLEAWPGAGP